MFTKRLTERVASARFITIARLDAHVLKFQKISKDHSTKADAYFSNNSSDMIFGVVFEIKVEEMGILDRFEGNGNGYSKNEVKVVDLMDEEKELTVFTYYATNIDLTGKLKPYDWYLKYVIEGAQEHNLPVTYIDNLKKIPSILDTDKGRIKLEGRFF